MSYLPFSFQALLDIVEKYERQTDPYGKAMKKQKNKTKIYIFLNKLPKKYVFFCFLLLFTSSSPCRKDQFVVSYFSTSLIVLIQVYNWEVRHHTVCCRLSVC